MEARKFHLRHFAGMIISVLVLVVCSSTTAWAQRGELTHASADDPLLQSLTPDVRKNYVVTPGGLYYRYCMLEAGDIKLADGSIRFSDGTIRPAGPCPYPDFPVRPAPPPMPAR